VEHPRQRCILVKSAFLKSSCHPSQFGTIGLLSSYTPADFSWPLHARCCISEPGWSCTRQREAPPQRRDLPAKFFDNNTLRITPLFVRLCWESSKTAQFWRQNPQKHRRNSLVCNHVHVTHLFVRLCWELIPKSLILHGGVGGTPMFSVRCLTCHRPGA